MDPRMHLVFRTGDKVRTIKENDVGLGTNPTGNHIMPIGSEGIVIEDLNEVEARQERKDAATWLPAKLCDLALVKFGEAGQGWFRYGNIEKISPNV
jgi:hypothetical protein